MYHHFVAKMLTNDLMIIGSRTLFIAQKSLLLNALSPDDANSINEHDIIEGKDLGCWPGFNSEEMVLTLIVK